MDVQLDKRLATTSTKPAWLTAQTPERLIVWYWVIASMIGIPILWDWLLAWNVGATLAMPWLVGYLICSFVLSQVLYLLVARHGGRSIHWGAVAIFAVGNGLAETFAFAAIYRAGEVLGAGITSLFAPAGASLAGFMLGVIFFSIYGGLIHALFWMKVLPPHLDEAPRSRMIRKWRPIAEIALVLSWSLCLWLTRDIWTVIFFHTLVDIGLMLIVRPAIFGASRQ